MLRLSEEIKNGCHWRDVYIDSLQYLGLVGSLTVISTYSPATFVGFVAIIFLTHPKASSSFESQWLNWFEIAKLISALAGVVGILWVELFRSQDMNLFYFGFLLAVNIGEAVLSEVQMNGLKGVANAIVGLSLIVMLPWNHLPLQHEMSKMMFPLSPAWILLYTLWNASFSYIQNYSHSTRVCLLVPIGVCLMMDGVGYWLTARTFSLVLNMALRVTQYTRLFTPGQSFLTKAKDDPPHSTNLGSCMGLLNLGLLTCSAIVTYKP